MKNGFKEKRDEPSEDLKDLKIIEKKRTSLMKGMEKIINQENNGVNNMSQDDLEDLSHRPTSTMSRKEFFKYLKISHQLEELDKKEKNLKGKINFQMKSKGRRKKTSKTDNETQIAEEKSCSNISMPLSCKPTNVEPGASVNPADTPKSLIGFSVCSVVVGVLTGASWSGPTGLAVAAIGVVLGLVQLLVSPFRLEPPKPGTLQHFTKVNNMSLKEVGLFQRHNTSPERSIEKISTNADRVVLSS